MRVMAKSMLIATICAAFVCRPNEGLGQGAIPVRISVPDGAGGSRCINAASDQVWITLRRVITNRSQGWFTQDNTVGTVINATVKGKNVDKPPTFPLMTESRLQGMPTGQVSVPIEYTIIDGLQLKQGTVVYTGISLELTLLNKRGRTKWGNALQALVDVTSSKKLPIPASPITQAAGYLLEYANTAVTQDLASENKDDKAKSAALAFNFDPTGKCSGSAGDGSDFERTGTVAIVQSEGTPGDGLVDIKQVNNYCWSAELKPAFILKVAGKDPAKRCESADYTPAWKQVSNNYVAFFVNAIPSTGVLGPANVKDREASLTRCSANGIAPQDCLK